MTVKAIAINDLQKKKTKQKKERKQKDKNSKLRMINLKKFCAKLLTPLCWTLSQEVWIQVLARHVQKCMA